MPNDTATETVGKVGTTFIQSLPAQFLLLAFINTVFILGLLWYLSKLDGYRSTDEAARVKILEPLLTACIRGQAYGSP